jgi:cysteinyl-tRNA synthetase
MHMGHARTYLFYDVLVRYLRWMGNRVTFVMNVTDVDERITEVAREAHADPERLAIRYTTQFLEDMSSLGIDTVTTYEKVSNYVDIAQKQIAVLIEKGYAYVVDGWVYFDVSAFPYFGRLSHMSKRDLSLRPLELSAKKRNLLDFSLWRPEVLLRGKWRSPWGLGSPGWHIQDTAVTLTRLGPTYDIHGGAYELIYPHHEAEIAQAESITGVRPLVRYWIHTRLVNTEGAKMSKSAGNVYNVRDALKKFTSDEIRYFFLKHHYREDLGLEGLKDAAEEYRVISRRIRELSPASKDDSKPNLTELTPFFSAMNDDLDTPRAVSWLTEDLSSTETRLDASSMQIVSEVLGLDLHGSA